MTPDRLARRIGDDPAVVLRNYTKRKRTKKTCESLSNAITALAAGFLKSQAGLGPTWGPKLLSFLPVLDVVCANWLI
jgi:hypothetical protein